MGNYFDETIETESLNLGGGTYPWCGTGWLGIGYSLTRYGNEFIYAYDFGGWYSIIKILNDGTDSLIYCSEDDNQNQISSVYPVVNSKGEYLMIYFNSSEYDSTLGVFTKSFAKNDTLLSTNIIENFLERGEYAYWGDRKSIKAFAVNDSLFQILFIDSLKLKTYKVDINGNLLSKNIYPIYNPSREEYNFYTYSDNFSMSNFNDGSKQILISLNNFTVQSNTLFLFDSEGELISEPIFDSTFNYRLGESFFKNKANQFNFTTTINNSAYLMKYDNFNLIDSIKISKPIAKSNEVKPVISKYNDDFFVAFNNEVETIGRGVSVEGISTTNDIKLNSKKHQFFDDGTSMVVWNNGQNYTTITSGFSIYDENFNLIKTDTLINSISDNYGFCSGNISPNGELFIIYQNLNGVFIAKYTKNGELIKSSKFIEEAVRYRRWAEIFYDDSNIFVQWNKKIFTLSNDLHITKTSRNDIYTKIFKYWGDDKFGSFVYYSYEQSLYYSLFNSYGDTLVPNIDLANGEIFSEVKAGYAKPNQFIVLYKSAEEIYTKTYNIFGEMINDKFIVHKIENETINDVSFAVNGDKIIFTWSGKKESEDNYDIYAVSYNLDRVTNVEEILNNNLAEEFQLFQNYPNPFNPSTVIKYQIPANVKSKMSNIKLIIFDILGRKVATLVNQNQKAGNYEVEFDAADFSSGIYYYQLSAGSFIETKKMILLK
ncbi:MAG: T9SS type A sorting domain-containing protein [Melioribacteraceae bacterium]|nr:T9SS type A sorting domain-containing protein [Melioribacteraceae bacterium]